MRSRLRSSARRRQPHEQRRLRRQLHVLPPAATASRPPASSATMVIRSRATAARRGCIIEVAVCGDTRGDRSGTVRRRQSRRRRLLFVQLHVRCTRFRVRRPRQLVSHGGVRRRRHLSARPASAAARMPSVDGHARAEACSSSTAVTIGRIVWLGSGARASRRRKAFGDPTTTTGYGFCLYDAGDQLIMSARIPAGVHWKGVASGSPLRRSRPCPADGA